MPSASWQQVFSTSSYDVYSIIYIPSDRENLCYHKFSTNHYTRLRRWSWNEIIWRRSPPGKTRMVTGMRLAYTSSSERTPTWWMFSRSLALKIDYSGRSMPWFLPCLTHLERCDTSATLSAQIMFPNCFEVLDVVQVMFARACVLPHLKMNVRWCRQYASRC